MMKTNQVFSRFRRCTSSMSAVKTALELPVEQRKPPSFNWHPVSPQAREIFRSLLTNAIPIMQYVYR